MQFFHYVATDKQGKSTQGTVQANSQDEAVRNLAHQGLKVNQIIGGGSAGPSSASSTPPKSPPPSRPAPKPSAPKPKPSVAKPKTGAISQNPKSNRPRSAREVKPGVPSQSVPGVVMNAPKAPAKKKIVRTRKASDKALFLVFAQLAAYMHSGINPAQAFSDVSNRVRRADYQRSLADIAQKVGEGSSIADELERYPDLYPSHVVGVTRAGEHGAFLPEAFKSISDQAENSYKLKRWFTWFWWILLTTIASVPPAIVAVRAALDSWKVQDESGGTAPPFQTVIDAFVKNFMEMLPALLIVTIGSLVVWYIWNRKQFSRVRHYAVLKTPVIGKRAKSESLAMFAWILGMVSKGGVYHSNAWKLAAGAVPNLEVRRQLDAGGKLIDDRHKLSDALYQTRIIPEEYGPMVQTGEMTGDIPGALMNVSNISNTEFKTHETLVRVKLGCWMLIISILGTAILLVLVYRSFYDNIFQMLDV